MPEKLKPCPFCGSENINLRAAMGETWVFCHGCAASTNMKSSEESAVTAWNQRPEKPQATKEGKKPCENCPEWEALKHTTDPYLIHCPTCGRILAKKETPCQE